MTVIAYRDGVMAGDGRVTSGKYYIERDDDQKVFKLADGSLIGFAGSVSGILVIKKTMEDAAKEKKKGRTRSLPDLSKIKNAECLFASPAGDVWFLNRGVWEPIETEYTACGSGYDTALIAMDAGLSARDAVALTCRRNSSCGGRIRVVKLDV